MGLISASNIAGITFDNCEITAVQLKEGCKFYPYEFREDEAEYRETVSFANGAYTVLHELKFLLEKMDTNSYISVRELISKCPAGIVAAVISANNDCFIAGYSPEFKAERPLRLTSAIGTTGKALKDATNEIITLQSTDVSKSYNYLNFESLFYVKA